MGGEWPKLQLSELCSYINRGSAPAYTEDNGILVLNQKCIRDQRVNFSLGRRTDPRKKKIANERMLQPFDILVNSTGIGTLGRVAQILDLPEPATVDSHVTILRPNQEIVDPHYLGYVLRCFERSIEMLGEGSTGQTELARSRLASFSVPISPDRDEQRAIARILGTLDDKIELNRRMNETLEAMAQALFKSWFVDFDPVVVNAIRAGNPIPEKFAAKAAHYSENPDALGLPEHILRLFPDRFVDSELGPVPERWEVGPLSTIAKLRTETIVPRREPEAVWEHYSIPAFDQGRMAKLERGIDIKSGKYKVPITAVLASKLNPQFPRVWLPNVINEDRAICSTEFMPFVPVKAEWRSLLYELLKSDLVQEGVRAAATGSTGSRQRVKPKTVASMPMIVAPAEILDTFCDQITSAHNLVLSNERESRILATLRETLLPKLISGELRVPDVEKILEEAT